MCRGLARVGTDLHNCQALLAALFNESFFIHFLTVKILHPGHKQLEEIKIKTELLVQCYLHLVLLNQVTAVTYKKYN